MAVKKNYIAKVNITSLSSDGNGVCHIDGLVVFVPGAAVGDELRVKIVKVLAGHAFAIIENILAPGAGRIEVDCPVFARCGGCNLRHISYEAELAAKADFVHSAFKRLGKIEVAPLPCTPSPNINGYRNKAVYPFAFENGKLCVGFYAERSHRVVPNFECLLQNSELNVVAEKFCEIAQKYSLELYNEQTHSGLLRHLYIRRGDKSGQILVCIVINGGTIPNAQQICGELVAALPAVKTIVCNINGADTNVILGKKTTPLYGDGFIEDELCGVPVKLDAHAFYQVNSPAAALIYSEVARLAAPLNSATVLDLYCGAGTIGLSFAKQCKALIGVEVVAQAVQSAVQNAAAMGATNVRFINADAAEAAKRLAAEGLKPDVIVMDPPRKGSDEATLAACTQMAPQKIIMVSCNPATAARDCAFLEKSGYKVQSVQPFDMFPRTKHVECVVLLARKDS